jgi:hypothetical protein
MARFRVLVFSPEYNVVRRFNCEADDEFDVIPVIEFMLEEKGCPDPEARLDVTEIP